MSDEPKKEEEKKPAAEPKKKGGAGLVIGIIIPALASAGAAFGAVKVTNKGPQKEHIVEVVVHKEMKPTGPTLNLEPFLVNVPDEHKKVHPFKLTVAVEFEEKVKEEMVKGYTPRIRDAVLSHVRTMTFEEASDHAHTDKLKAELLHRVQEAGATSAEKILVTDMVTQ